MRTATSKRPTSKASDLQILDVFRDELTCRPSVSVSQWAESYRTMPQWSPKPGRWRNENSPYLADIMDAFTDDSVETIVVVAAAQVGKTEFILNCLGWIVCEEPGQTLVTLPSEKEADRFAKRRIHPMVTGSDAVLRHVAGGSDALGLKEMVFDRCTITTAWSNSPGAMSSSPCRWVFGDEVDKYPPYAGREGSPIRLIEARTLHFEGRCKKVWTSTPTTELGYIWPLYERSTQHQFHVPCRKCGRFQVMDFHASVKWPKKATPIEIYEKRLAWYECTGRKCAAKWNDAQKMRAVKRGKWVARGQTISKDGRISGRRPPRLRVGYQISGLYSPMMSFSKAASIFLESVGDIGLMHDFKNTVLGLPFQDRVEVVTEKKLKRARAPYREGTVPDGARVLTAGIDVQEDHFWITIRAWGAHEKSWLVRSGQLLKFKDVEAAINAAYPAQSSDRRHGVDLALIDSGYRTTEVYDFVRKMRRRGVFASKGSNHPGMTRTTPKASFPEPGVALYVFSADYWKDKLSGLMDAAHGGPGEWRIPLHATDEYIKHMQGERRIWRCLLYTSDAADE